VTVFKGKVEATGSGDPRGTVGIEEAQTAVLDRGTVQVAGAPDRAARDFVRAIVPPPVIQPRSLTLTFKQPAATTILDRQGRGSGFTYRLPGTGAKLPASDPNLALDSANGHLELTTTNSDINRQVNMPTGEYLGFKLADLGFTGEEDFEVTADVPGIPALRRVGQFGLYAGSNSDRVIRGGLISRKDSGEYTQFMVNNNGGRDTDSNFIGLTTSGDDLRVILRRTAGKYALTVENQTTGGSSTQTIRHPEFLDGDKDLHVGFFGANTQSNDPKMLVIKQVSVTVWTAVHARAKQ
jgi:hypothetical protein